MKEWKTFEKYYELCSMYMIGAYKDSSCYDKSYSEFKRVLEQQRSINPQYGLTIDDLEEITEDEHDFFFFIEDYLDFLEMNKSYQKLLDVCEELCELFKNDDALIDEINSYKSIAFGSMGKNKENVEFCKTWLKQDKENIRAATLLVRALTDNRSYDEALELAMNYIDDVNECHEHNEIMFRALADLYKAMGKKKEMRKLNKVIKEYEDYIDEQFLNALEEDDDDWFF